MIDKECLDELNLISDLIDYGTISTFQVIVGDKMTAVSELMFNAVSHAIRSDSDTKNAIYEIVHKTPLLATALKRVVKEKYPEHSDYLDKLLILI